MNRSSKIDKYVSVSIISNCILFNTLGKDNGSCCGSVKKTDNNNSSNKNNSNNSNNNSDPKDEHSDDDQKNKELKAKKDAVITLLNSIKADNEKLKDTAKEKIQVTEDDINSKESIEELNKIESTLNNNKAQIDEKLKDNNNLKGEDDGKPKGDDGKPKEDDEKTKEDPLKIKRDKLIGIFNSIKTKNNKLPKKFKEAIGDNIEADIKSARTEEDLNSIETNLNKILAKLNKIIIFNEFIIAFLYSTNNHVYFYSAKEGVNGWFAKSKDELKGEFKEENVKNLGLVYCDKIGINKGDKKTKSNFKSDNIESILKEVEQNENKISVLTDIEKFKDAKFINIKNCYPYIYDIVNDKIFIIKYYKTIKNYFIIKAVGAGFNCHCLDSKGQYAYWLIGKDEYKFAQTEKEINEFKENFLNGK